MTAEFSASLEKDSIFFDEAITEPDDKQAVYRITVAAEVIRKSLSALSEYRGKASFVLNFAKKGNTHIKNIQIGEVENLDQVQVLANLNACTLIMSPEAISTDEIFETSDRAGAVSIGDWIISVSGFKNPKMNTAVSLGIAFGAKIISYQEAENLAHDPRINCVSEYMEHESAITDPFFRYDSNSEDFLLPEKHT